MIKKILLVVFIALCVVKVFAQNDPPPEKAPPPKDGKHDGLQVDRAAVIKTITADDTTLHFKPKGQENKMPVMLAIGTNNTVAKLVGTEYNLREVSYKVFIDVADAKSLQGQFTKIAHLVGLIIPRRELLQWMLKHYWSVHDHPEKAVGERYSDDGNLLDFDYNPDQKWIMLTIDTEYQ